MDKPVKLWGNPYAGFSIVHSLVIALYAGGLRKDLASLDAGSQKLVKDAILGHFVIERSEQEYLKAARRLPYMVDIVPLVDEALKPVTFAHSGLDIPEPIQKDLVARLRSLFVKHALAEEPTYDPIELLEIFDQQGKRVYASEQEAILSFRRSVAALFMPAYGVSEVERTGRLPDLELFSSVIKTTLAQEGVANLAEASLKAQSLLMQRLDELFQGALANQQRQASSADTEPEAAQLLEAIRAIARVLRWE